MASKKFGIKIVAIVLTLVGFVGTVFSLVASFFLKKKSTFFSNLKKYESVREEKANELEKKDAATIVNDLDNSSDVERIKTTSSEQVDAAYRKRKQRKWRNYLDRFRGTGSGGGNEEDKG